MLATLAVVVGTVCGVTAAAPVALADEPTASDCGSDYSPDTPEAFAALNIPRAWSISRGAGVTVAVIDSGVDGANPHLKGAVRKGVNVTNAPGGSQTDAVGTGTAIAAQIAARQVDGSGLQGVAPQATILPVRVFSPTSDRDDGELDPDLVAEGIEWATAHGARIVVVPRAAPVTSARLDAAVAHAIDAGALIVASTGDAEQTDTATAARYPAAIRGVLSVSAVDSTGKASSTAVHNTHVGITAPGQNVMTTLPGKGDCLLASDQPTAMYATGYVAGAAALVASAYSDERPASWANRLQATASRPLAIQPADDRTLVGWGVVAPYEALNLVDDGTAPGPMNPDPAAREVPPPVAWPQPAADSLPTIRLIVAGVVAVTAAIALALGLIKKITMRRRRR